MTTNVLPRPEVAPARPWTFPKAQRFSLPNGLSVVAYDLPGKQVAAIRVLLDLPLHCEPKGLEGIAQITVTSLDEGTERFDAQAFANARNRLGASYGAGADATGGTLSLDVPVSRLTAALELLAEAVLRPTFPAPEVDRLVKQRLDAISSERANPDSRARIELAAAWYARGSRRALPAGGTTESVAAIDRDAVESFYRGQVDPATTTVIVAGDLSDVDLTALVTACFGDWPTQGRVRATAPSDDVVGGPGVVVVDRPGSVQTMLSHALPGVDRNNADMPQLQVAARILGGGMDSRIMAVLREEKGYTYGISAQAAAEQTDGRVLIGGSVQTEVTGPAVEDLVAILREFAASGVREGELVPAIEALTLRAPLSYERPQAVAQAASTIIGNGLADDYIDTSRAAVRATTESAVHEAFIRSAPLGQALLVAVGDGAVITESLKAAGLGDVTVIPA